MNKRFQSKQIPQVRSKLNTNIKYVTQSQYIKENREENLNHLKIDRGQNKET